MLHLSVVWKHTLITHPVPAPQPLSFTVFTSSVSAALCLSAFFFVLCFFLLLCVPLMVSDSQSVEKKTSLQIRAGWSTRSLEYRAVRAQRHSDTYWISQHTWVTKQLWEEREGVVGEWEAAQLPVLLIYFKKRNKRNSLCDFCPCFFYPPSPSSFIPRTNLSCRSDVISLLSSAGTQGSLSNADELCVCVFKSVCMCIVTWAHFQPDLHYSIIKKKKKTGQTLWSRCK